MNKRQNDTGLLLLCSHSPNGVPPEPQQNVSIAAVRGAVRPSKNDTGEVNLRYIVPFLSLNTCKQLSVVHTLTGTHTHTHTHPHACMPNTGIKLQGD